MESSRNKRGNGYGQEDTDNLPDSKRHKLPALASVIVEAVKVDSLQRLCSSLEPLFRRIVSEEVERALSNLGNAKLTSRSQEPEKILGADGRSLQLDFRTRMPPHLFTGGKVEGEQGLAIHVVLTDASTGNVVRTGQESSVSLQVVVLEGDFNDEDWTREHFESFEVKEREGKRPILTGETNVTLKGGVGTLGDITFTDNSSWIRSRKFRLGVKAVAGNCLDVRIREAKTEAFAVKDHRGELYKKHYPPALHDEVWRLDRIAKDGALHKKLMKANIVTVEDFLRFLVKDPQKLRNILGSGMSNRMWENTMEHAKTCVLGGKLYVYYTDQTRSAGVVFNHIYEFQGLISDNQFISLESLHRHQKVSADTLVKTAYENWHRVVEYDGNTLSCLSMAKKETKSLPETKMAAVRTTHFRQPPSEQRQIENTANHHYMTSVYRTMESPLPALPCNVQDYPLMASSMGSSGSYNAGDWCRPERSGQVVDDVFAEEIRARSSEMLESNDMQRLLKTFGIGVNGDMGIQSEFGNINEECCYSGYGGAGGGPYESRVDNGAYGRQRGRGGSSGKAVVGWLKLKAALRWGIFVRKKAAEKRLHLVEID